MSDNMKHFLEKVSQDPALTEKLQQAKAVPELMELAASLGVTLTEADFNQDAEISNDEQFYMN